MKPTQYRMPVKPKRRPQPQPAKAVDYRPVPLAWPGSTVVCIGAGPSLTRTDCEYVRGKARVIAINTSIEMTPWADALYACDARWFKWVTRDPKRYPGYHAFRGLKFSMMARIAGVHTLRNTGCEGIELKPHGLRNGRNGGYQAINLAVHLGAARILLLGYDMQRVNGKEHWHGDHPHATHSPYTQFRKSFETLVKPMQELGIPVINCTPNTALTCFPTMPLRQALPVEVSEAVA